MSKTTSAAYADFMGSGWTSLEVRLKHGAGSPEHKAAREEVERLKAEWVELLDEEDDVKHDAFREIQRHHFEECVVANWDPARQNTFSEELVHLHEEVSEAFKAWRIYRDFEIHYEGGRPQGVPVELADVLIGIFYNAELHGIDLCEALRAKGQFNRARDYVAEGRQLHGPAMKGRVAN